MGLGSSNDSFPSALGNQVTATQFICTFPQWLWAKCWEAYIIIEKEIECKLAPHAPQKVFNQLFISLELPANVDHYQMKYSNKAAEQLALRKAGNLW
jgi:hypothetical protein